MAGLVSEIKALDGDKLLETWEDSLAACSAVFRIAVPGASSSGRSRKPRDRSDSRTRPGSTRRRDPKLNQWVLDSDDDEDQLGRKPIRDHHGRLQGPLDCPPLVQPTPPPTQATKETDDAALQDHLRHCAMESKNYIRAHRDHGHFSRRSTSVKPISIVQRGAKITAAQIQRWMQAPRARPDDVDTFFNADDNYYSNNGYWLNPKKECHQQLGLFRLHFSFSSFW